MHERMDVPSFSSNESKAETVYAIVPDFLEEAKYLYAQLVQRDAE